ncbi:MAG TPA: hypothetical protein VER33_03875 [Polyangiaceae bacterium]|nr:hypothetical protein [Polyangiaceae bacterium]
MTLNRRANLLACSLLAAASWGCGDSGSSGNQGGSSGNQGGSSGSAGTTLGGSSNAGAGGQLRPPNPRTNIGPPDGVPCDLTSGTATCSPGQKCCIRFPWDDNACIAASEPCAVPNHSVTELACDGPEDCPMQLCCAFDTAAGNIEFERVACAASCQANSQAVVCKDARDCLDAEASCSQSSHSSFDRCF